MRNTKKKTKRRRTIQPSKEVRPAQAYRDFRHPEQRKQRAEKGDERRARKNAAGISGPTTQKKARRRKKQEEEKGR